MAWRGHLSRNLKELRLHFCQTSPASSAAREFVLRNYKDLKTLNPAFPIIIRECSGAEPQLWARYAAPGYTRAFCNDPVIRWLGMSHDTFLPVDEIWVSKD